MDGGISSSFIEAFKTASTEVKSFIHSPNKDESKSETKTPGEFDDIFAAAKSGCLESVKSFPAYELNTLDNNGHSLSHWAALFGHYELMEYLIRSRVLFNIASRHDMGQYPIHWACVNNHYQIVDLLLKSGVHIDLKDSAGATPLIVAAQYGSFATCAMLLSKGADLQALDNEGDSALHWAAFKGNPDLCRMLVYSGLDPKQEDNFRQTPLHMACISGNLRTVKEFHAVDRVDIFAVDANGRLPVDLAKGRNYADIMFYLQNEMESAKRLLPKCDFSSLVYGPSGNTNVPIMFYVFLIVFWGYPMYILKALPLTFVSHYWLHVVFIISNVMIWLNLYHCNSVDPGYLPRNTREYDHVIKQMGKLDQQSEQSTSQLGRLCHSCRLVKAPRVSHCVLCNRCISDFDHHCPYVANCVGHNNRHTFLMFITATSFVILMSLYLIHLVWSHEEYQFRWDYAIGSSFMALFSLLTLYVMFSVWNNALKNVTTNERLRWKYYSYLKDADGNFKNPYNLNAIANFLYTFHLVSMTLNDGKVKAIIRKPDLF